jgi:dipeptidase E
MGKIVAIGGGEIGELETLPIDKKIVRLAKKKKPKVLFIPTASNDAGEYCATIQKIYGNKLKCQVDFLLLIRNKENLTKKEISKKILSADIIYVGGGNTMKMLRIWRKAGVDKLLKKAYKKNIILAGLSAGTICWFRYGVSDSIINPRKKELFGKIKGLDLISLKQAIIFSPHNIREKKIREKSIKEIMLYTPGICLAVDDNAALFIETKFNQKTRKEIQRYEIWKSKKNVKIIKYSKKNKRLVRERIAESDNMDNLF